MLKHTIPAVIPVAMSCLAAVPVGGMPHGADARPAVPALPADRDITLLAEAFHLWHSLGDDVWPGWTEETIPFIYVTSDWDYAVGFPEPLSGFSAMENATFIQNRAVQVRPRRYDPSIAAAFRIQGIPSVVMGAPEHLDWTPNQWVVKAVHEMFHVLQMTRSSELKTAAIKIGSPDNNN